MNFLVNTFHSCHRRGKASRRRKSFDSPQRACVLAEPVRTHKQLQRYGEGLLRGASRPTLVEYLGDWRSLRLLTPFTI